MDGHAKYPAGERLFLCPPQGKLYFFDTVRQAESVFNTLPLLPPRTVNYLLCRGLIASQCADIQFVAFKFAQF